MLSEITINQLGGCVTRMRTLLIKFVKRYCKC